MGYSYSTGGGLSVLANHTHTAAVADGGVLSKTVTLLGTTPIYTNILVGA